MCKYGLQSSGNLCELDRNQTYHQLQNPVISSIRVNRANLRYLIPYLSFSRPCDILTIPQITDLLTYLDSTTVLENNDTSSGYLKYPVAQIVKIDLRNNEHNIIS